MKLRSLILRSEAIRATAAAAILNLPIDEAHPWQVTMTIYRRQRGNPANSLYWCRLAEIASQAWIAGKQFDADTLHIFCKQSFLPDQCAKGIDKWTLLPNGDRALRMSTTSLNTSEFAEYLEQVTAWGAGLGVHFSADREA